MFNPSSVSEKQLGGYYAKDDYYLKNFSDSLTVFGQGGHDKNLGAVKSMDQRELFASLVKDRKCKAHDLTFSPPKSVSIMWAIGTDAQQELALHAQRVGVAAAMKYIEKNLFFVQRKQNGITKTYEACGMVALSIDHSVSRPVEAHGAGESDTYQDPQVHSHVLLANAGYIIDDKKKINRSVNFYQIYQAQKQIDRVYKMAMRREFQKAGCETRKTENGFELDDISNVQNRHFSNRAIQVEKNLSDIGLTSAEATGSQHNSASLKDRLKKKDDDDVSSAKLRNEWKERADNVDVDLTWIPFEDPRPEERDEKTILRVVRKAFQEHVAINPISTKGKAIYDILDLAETAHEDDPDKNPLVDFDDIIKHLPAIMKLERMIRLPGQKENQKSLKEQFVSVDLMLKGQENYQYLVQGNGIYTNAMTDFEEKMDAMAKDLFEFTFEGEQRDAAIGVLASKNLITSIIGVPGSGKTTILEIIAELQGKKNMIALSTAGSAAQKLGSEIGVEARTIAKFLLDWKIRDELLDLPQRSAKQEARLKGTQYLENLTRDPSKNGLIIIDEASMTGDINFNAIARIAKETGSKIILAGDTKQLSGVQSGELFKKFELSGQMEIFNLKKIMRQKDKRYRKAVQAISGRDITDKDSAKRAVDALNLIKDAIKIRKTAKGRIDLMVRDYMETVMAGESYPMVITGTNDVKDIMNEKIREKLKAIGKIEHEGETHLVKCGTRGAKREKEFCVNDRILFLQNDNRGDVQVSSGPKVLNGSQAVITSIQNGLVHGYLIDDEGESTNIDVCFDLTIYDRISSAFAITSYKAQGQSVSRQVMYHAPSTAANLNKQDFLVGISRNKNNLSVYTDNIKAMIKKVSRWASKDDAYQAFKTGYEFSGGQSKYVQMIFKAIEENDIRSDPISADRQATIDKYGILRDAPRAIQDSIVKRKNESRSIFMKDLKDAQKWANNSSHLSNADDVLLKAYQIWYKDKLKALKRRDKDKKVKVKNGPVTYYRALDKALADFCKNIGKMQGHKQIDELNEHFYQDILTEINDVETKKIVFPKIKVQKVEGITLEPVVLSEEDQLHNRMYNLYNRKVKLINLGDNGRRNLVIAKVQKQDPKSYDDYLDKKVSLEKAQARFNALEEKIGMILKNIETHELTKDGTIGTRLKRLISPGKVAKLDLLVKQYDKLQEDQKALGPKIEGYEAVVKRFDVQVANDMEIMKKAHNIKIQELSTQVQAIEDKLIELSPPEPTVYAEDIFEEDTEEDFEEYAGLRPH